MSDEMPSNVIAALARVTAEMGGIQKTRGGEGGISYAYRGIDAIAASAQPLLGKYGVVIVPETQIQRIEELSVNGKPWTDTFITVTWTIYGPGGVDDRITAVTQGVGRDNSDKGFNKSATQAFKNLLLRVLCIGDPNDDADAPQHQNNFTDDTPRIAPDDIKAGKATFARLKELGDRGGEFKAELAELCEGENPGLSERVLIEDRAWRLTVVTLLDKFNVEAKPVTAEPVAEIVSLASTTRDRVDALSPAMKKALREDSAAEGIKNMLMPTKAQEPWIVAWLDRLDAETTEAAILEQATGAVNDVGGSDEDGVDGRSSNGL